MAITLGVHALVTCDTDILILKRGPYKYKYAGYWDLPGGTLDLGEQPLEGMIRELYEETGMIVSYAPCLGALTYKDHQGAITGLVVYYHIQTIRHEIQLSSEHIGYEWVSLPALGGLTQKREIIDDALLLYSVGESK